MFCFFISPFIFLAFKLTSYIDTSLQFFKSPLYSIVLFPLLSISSSTRSRFSTHIRPYIYLYLLTSFSSPLTALIHLTAFTPLSLLSLRVSHTLNASLHWLAPFSLLSSVPDSPIATYFLSVPLIPRLLPLSLTQYLLTPFNRLGSSLNASLNPLYSCVSRGPLAP